MYSRMRNLEATKALNPIKHEPYRAHPSSLVHMPPQSQVRLIGFLPSFFFLAHNANLSCLFRHVITAASEVSSILESRISGTSVGGNVEETGRVLSMFFYYSRARLSTYSVVKVLVTVLAVFGV